MKREIEKYVRNASGCCPNHDKYPDDSYESNRSKKARSKGKITEHKRVRTAVKAEIKKILDEDKQIELDIMCEEIMRYRFTSYSDYTNT